MQHKSKLLTIFVCLLISVASWAKPTAQPLPDLDQQVKKARETRTAATLANMASTLETQHDDPSLGFTYTAAPGALENNKVISELKARGWDVTRVPGEGKDWEYWQIKENPTASINSFFKEMLKECPRYLVDQELATGGSANESLPTPVTVRCAQAARVWKSVVQALSEVRDGELATVNLDAFKLAGPALQLVEIVLAQQNVYVWHLSNSTDNLSWLLKRPIRHPST
jgi:hypothetical protein